MSRKIVLTLMVGLLLVQFANGQSGNWVSLLNEDHSKHWEVFIGVPHGTVKGLPGIDPASDGKKGEPLGVNNDPKSVFSFEDDGSEVVLHISGEIYGALSSKAEYENYHLKLQFKWGEKKWEPRLDRERDNGILYHCVGPHGAFWNVWMQSQEFQVQQGDMGDYYSLAKTEIEIPAVAGELINDFDYKKGAEKKRFSSIDPSVYGHCDKGSDNEKPHGEWNTLELICIGGSSLHVVNGKVVMALYNSQYLDPNDNIVPLTKGKIQLQSEGAEAFYKNIQIRSIKKIPQEYKDQL
ncbi:MAG: DUF1080 domain-containing protein [Cyclobacteriaceae bacterium]